MNKKTKIIAAVFAVLLTLGVLRFMFYSCAWGFSTATLHYKGYHGGKKSEVTTVLEKDDWREIARIFNFNLYEEKWSRCPVNEDFSITAGGITYYIASDGCDIVYVPSKNMCFRIGEDRTTLNRILAKYGVEGYPF